VTLADTGEAYWRGASKDLLGSWIADRGIRDTVLSTKVAAARARASLYIGSVESAARSCGNQSLQAPKLG